ncbi:hypothetical protein PPYR_08571 [Photinus pyralis]|uniref:Uncharacterized protein n=1 Tax=Photinus pyralis TaxID=7054 RepID=A0A5N4AK32_PHOPY|nr:uncharacterized protein LOC116171700 [Photinus pyralis]KAB0797578.1 hypothetical protein PPYR_08571 [Photinus pyralis]
MKSFILLCVQIILAQSKLHPQVITDWNNLQKDFIESCSKEANLDPTIPPRILEDLYMPDEANFQCYIRCVMRNNKLILPDNNVNAKELAEVVHITPETAMKCIKSAETETDVCRKPYLVGICCIESKFETQSCNS